MYNVNDYLNSYITDNILLLALVLEKNHAWLITNKDYILTSEEKNTLKPLIEQREQGVPFAYLSGVKGFYHLDFIVTPDTFIPRPETELLIDITLDLFKDKSCRLLDLGTGSGIIAITLADKNPYWQVVATDFSKQALELAKQNTVINIDFQQGNWFEAVQDKQFNLIISNPPYIKQDDPCLKDLIYEPQTALVSGKDGLDDIRIIIKQAPQYLISNGFLLLEHGYNQQMKIVELLKENFTHIRVFKDYNSNERAVLAQLKS